LVGNYSNISPKAHTPATRLYANRPPFDQAVSAHFFGAMEIDGFINKDEFKKQIDEWIHVFRNTNPAPTAR